MLDIVIFLSLGKDAQIEKVDICFVEIPCSYYGITCTECTALSQMFSPASLAALQPSAFWCMGYRCSQFRILLLLSCIMYPTSGNSPESHPNDLITSCFMNLNNIEEYMLF